MAAARRMFALHREAERTGVPVGDPADQSALDVIGLLTHNPRASVVPLGGDDERFHMS